MDDVVFRVLDIIPARPLSEADRKINRVAWVRLWTLATSTPGYSKPDWIRVEAQLSAADLI